MTNVLDLSPFLSHPDAIPRGKESWVRVFPDARGGWAMSQEDETGGSFFLYATKAEAVRAALWHVETFNAEMTLSNRMEGAR